MRRMERLLLPGNSAETSLFNEVLQEYVWNNEVAFVAWFLEGIIQREHGTSQEEVPWLKVSPDIDKDFEPIRTPDVQQKLARYALVIASANGYVPMLQDILLKTDGIDVNWVHPGTSDTALSTAVQWGRLDVFHVLVEHGADLTLTSANGDLVALRGMLERGDLPMLKSFLRLTSIDLRLEQVFDEHGQAGNGNKQSILEYAARRGKTGIVRHLLLSSSFSPQQLQTANRAADLYGRDDCSALIREAFSRVAVAVDDDETPEQAPSDAKIVTLADALERGHLGKVKKLLDTAGPGIVQENALLQAIALDDAQALQVLVDAVADKVTFDCGSLLSKCVELSAVNSLGVLRSSALKGNVLGFASLGSFEEELVRGVVNWHSGEGLVNAVKWNTIEPDLAEELLEASVIGGNLRTVGKLLQCKGCKPVLQKPELLKTLVGIAAASKHFDIIGLLMDNDKGVSYKETLVTAVPAPFEFSSGVDYMNLLQLSLRAPYLDLLTYLSSKRFEIQQFSYESYIGTGGYIRVALFECARDDNVAAARALLKREPAPKTDMLDEDGNSMLHYCVSESMMTTLLDAPKVDRVVTAKNKEGVTALEVALQAEWYGAVEVLTKFSGIASSDVYASLRWDLTGSFKKVLDFAPRPGDLNLPNEEDGMTLFMRACTLCEGNPANLVMLLETFDNVIVDSKNPKNKSSGLHYACKAGLFEVLEHLLENKFEMPNLNHVDDQGYTPLIAAVSSGNAGLVRVLLEHPHVKHRLDRNVVSSLGTALTFGIDAVRLNNDSPRGNTDRMNIITMFLEDDLIDLNLVHAGYTPLMKLATLGDDFDPLVDIIRQHVDNGVINPSYSVAEDGNTALHVAAKYATRELLLLLLAQKDVDIDCTNTQLKTPLHVAAEECKVEVVRLLLASRANRAHKDVEGKTPLDIAQERSFTEIMALLSPRKLKRQISKDV